MQLRRSQHERRCAARNTNAAASPLSTLIDLSTLTLCSVEAPGRVLDEVARVLKPGSGRFLFCEHVLSETDPLLAAQQRALTPAQVISADGCHLDRRTLETIKAAERFKEVDATYFDLQGFYILNPTVAGIARV